MKRQITRIVAILLVPLVSLASGTPVLASPSILMPPSQEAFFARQALTAEPEFAAHAIVDIFDVRHMISDFAHQKIARLASRTLSDKSIGPYRRTLIRETYPSLATLRPIARDAQIGNIYALADLAQHLAPDELTVLAKNLADVQRSAYFGSGSLESGWQKRLDRIAARDGIYVLVNPRGVVTGFAITTPGEKHTMALDQFATRPDTPENGKGTLILESLLARWKQSGFTSASWTATVGSLGSYHDFLIPRAEYDCAGSHFTIALKTFLPAGHALPETRKSRIKEIAARKNAARRLLNHQPAGDYRIWVNGEPLPAIVRRNRSRQWVESQPGMGLSPNPLRQAAILEGLLTYGRHTRLIRDGSGEEVSLDHATWKSALNTNNGASINAAPAGKIEPIGHIDPEIPGDMPEEMQTKDRTPQDRLERQRRQSYEERRQFEERICKARQSAERAGTEGLKRRGILDQLGKVVTNIFSEHREQPETATNQRRVSLGDLPDWLFEGLGTTRTDIQACLTQPDRVLVSRLGQYMLTHRRRVPEALNLLAKIGVSSGQMLILPAGGSQNEILACRSLRALEQAMRLPTVANAVKGLSRGEFLASLLGITAFSGPEAERMAQQILSKHPLAITGDMARRYLEQFAQQWHMGRIPLDQWYGVFTERGQRFPNELSTWDSAKAVQPQVSIMTKQIGHLVSQQDRLTNLVNLVRPHFVVTDVLEERVEHAVRSLAETHMSENGVFMLEEVAPFLDSLSSPEMVAQIVQRTASFITRLPVPNLTPESRPAEQKMPAIANEPASEIVSGSPDRNDAPNLDSPPAAPAEHDAARNHPPPQIPALPDLSVAGRHRWLLDLSPLDRVFYWDRKVLRADAWNEQAGLWTVSEWQAGQWQPFPSRVEEHIIWPRLTPSPWDSESIAKRPVWAMRDPHADVRKAAELIGSLREKRVTRPPDTFFRTCLDHYNALRKPYIEAFLEDRSADAQRTLVEARRWWDITVQVDAAAAAKFVPWHRDLSGPLVVRIIDLTKEQRRLLGKELRDCYPALAHWFRQLSPEMAGRIRHLVQKHSVLSDYYHGANVSVLRNLAYSDFTLVPRTHLPALGILFYGGEGDGTSASGLKTTISLYSSYAQAIREYAQALMNGPSSVSAVQTRDYPYEGAEYARFAVPLLVGVSRDADQHPGKLITFTGETVVDQFVDLAEVTHLYVPVAYIPWVDRWIKESEAVIRVQLNDPEKAARDGFPTSRSAGEQVKLLAAFQKIQVVPLELLELLSEPPHADMADDWHRAVAQMMDSVVAAAPAVHSPIIAFSRWLGEQGILSGSCVSVKELLISLFGNDPISIIDIGSGLTEFLDAFCVAISPGITVSRKLAIDSNLEPTASRQKLTAQQAADQIPGQFSVATINGLGRFLPDLIEPAHRLLKEELGVQLLALPFGMLDLPDVRTAIQSLIAMGYQILSYKESLPDYPEIGLAKAAHLLAAVKSPAAPTASIQIVVKAYEDLYRRHANSNEFPFFKGERTTERGTFNPSDIENAVHLLKAAGVGPGVIFYDAGSGDGRIVLAAAALGAKAGGIEIDPTLHALALEMKAEIGKELPQAKSASFILGRIEDQDFSKAQVVFHTFNELWGLEDSPLLPETNFRRLERRLTDQLPARGVVILTFAGATFDDPRFERFTPHIESLPLDPFLKPQFYRKRPSIISPATPSAMPDISAIANRVAEITIRLTRFARSMKLADELDYGFVNNPSTLSAAITARLGLASYAKAVEKSPEYLQKALQLVQQTITVYSLFNDDLGRRRYLKAINSDSDSMEVLGFQLSEISDGKDRATIKSLIETGKITEFAQAISEYVEGLSSIESDIRKILPPPAPSDPTRGGPSGFDTQIAVHGGAIEAFISDVVPAVSMIFGRREPHIGPHLQNIKPDDSMKPSNPPPAAPPNPQAANDDLFHRVWELVREGRWEESERLLKDFYRRGIVLQAWPLSNGRKHVVNEDTPEGKQTFTTDLGTDWLMNAGLMLESESGSELSLSGQIWEDVIAAAQMVMGDLSTNIWKYAKRGWLLAVPPSVPAHRRTGWRIIALDQGPGIQEPDRVTEPGFSTIGTAGRGLARLTRQLDHETTRWLHEFVLETVVGKGTFVSVEVRPPAADRMRKEAA